MATDTLVATHPDLSPMSFASKVYALPHLRALMVTTGFMDFGQQWFSMLNGHFVAPNIDVVNLHAPTALRQLWREFQDKGPTSTIYHFVADAGRIRVFAFRSAADFQAEEFPDECMAFKPPFDGMTACELNSIEDFATAMEHQRAEQAALPLEDRVAIGGEIVLAELAADGRTSLWVGHRFPDYEGQLAAMISALPSNQHP